MACGPAMTGKGAEISLMWRTWMPNSSEPSVKVRFWSRGLQSWEELGSGRFGVGKVTSPDAFGSVCVHRRMREELERVACG
jgi:hypothetical protein